MAKKYSEADLDRMADAIAQAFIAEKDGDKDGMKALFNKATHIAENKGERE